MKTPNPLRLNCLVLLIAFVFLFNQSSSAQGFVWVKSYGGSEKDKGKDLGVDQVGNQYVAGFFRDQMNMGTINLQAVGGPDDEDIFISKMDIDGNPVWGHSMGNAASQSDDYPFGLSVNSNGFCASTGKCFGYVKLDNGDSLSGFGMEDMWLVSYDPNGNLNWAKLGGGSTNDMGTAVYVDNEQNVYCAGNFNGDMNFFGDSLITVSQEPNIYCAKYNWSGELLWVKTFNSETSVQVYDMTVDQEGNIYLSGNYRHTVNFGSYEFTSLGDGDGFIVKMTPAGDVLWATSFGSTVATSDETGATISLDASGNCYVAGTFVGNCQFNGGQITTGNNLKNIMVAAFDVDGNFMWANAIKGGPGAKFSPITLSIFAEENIMLTGIFMGIDTVGSIVLQPYTNVDSSDAFLVSFNPMGDVNWAIHVGGDGHDGGFGITGNGSAFAFATGNYRNTAQFGSNTLVSNGVSDMWVAKFQKNTITGNAAVAGTEKFQLFPNPFNNEFTVTIPKKTRDLTIFNQYGQVVYHRMILSSEKQISIDFPLPAAGIYTLQLSGEYGVTMGKIEKQAY
ncbi:MAG: T9SS type A sorting domain-containing protein [Chitinophagales bacterium]